MGLLKRKPVRKTVTLDSGLAASVEKLSDLSGISQGEIIAKAMDWWKISARWSPMKTTGKC